MALPKVFIPKFYGKFPCQVIRLSPNVIEYKSNLMAKPPPYPIPILSLCIVGLTALTFPWRGWADCYSSRDWRGEGGLRGTRKQVAPLAALGQNPPRQSLVSIGHLHSILFSHVLATASFDVVQ